MVDPAGDVFAPCRYMSAGDAVRITTDIKEIKKIDVNGDGVDDYVMVVQEEGWVCPDQHKSATTMQLLRFKADEGQEIGIKKKDGTEIKFGGIAQLGDKNYVVIGMPERQKIHMDGAVVDREKLVVTMIDIDALQSALSEGVPQDKKLEKILAGTMLARIGELKPSGISFALLKDGEKVKGLLAYIAQAGAKDPRLMAAIQASAIKHATDRKMK